MDLLTGLNPRQTEAVLHTDGPLLILAGAGSGKTRVLTHRAAYLIQEMQVNPWNIMAITFTNKAAREMRERIDKIVGQGSSSIWVSTFHSSCVRILRRYIDRIGYETNFSIYDSDDQKTLMKDICKKLKIDTKFYKEKMILGAISHAKDELISPEEYQRNTAGDYKKQINEDVLDAAVVEVITKLVANPRFASMMQEKINMKVDTTAINQEIKAMEKQLKQSYAVKRKTLEEIEALDPDGRHYKRLKADLDDRLYRMYDKIDDQEQSLIEAKAKKQSIESQKVTGDNIYKILIYFDKLYKLMNEEEQRKLMETLIEEIQIYEERQPSGQWLKSITFRLPIIEKDMIISVGDGLDSEQHVETIVLLQKLNS